VDTRSYSSPLYKNRVIPESAPVACAARRHLARLRRPGIGTNDNFISASPKRCYEAIPV
jgi:hypothetical protein